MATKKKSNNLLKAKSEWTIPEFQMWLAGAYALQGENWVPNEEQWGMIVEIIMKLKDRQPVAKRAVAPNVPVSLPPGYGGAPYNPAQPPSEPNSVLSGGDGANPAFNPDDVPQEARMPLSKLQEASRNGTLNSGASAVKTANIDTSKGYNSSYE